MFKCLVQTICFKKLIYLNSENLTGAAWFQVWTQVYFALQVPSVRFIPNIQVPPSGCPHFVQHGLGMEVLPNSCGIWNIRPVVP